MTDGSKVFGKYGLSNILLGIPMAVACRFQIGEAAQVDFK
jgi:hypothetical protein